MLKVIAIVSNVIGSGGGFDQALNAVMQMKRLSSDRFEFEVFTTEEANVTFLARLGVKAILVKISLLDRILIKISQNNIWQSLQNRLKWLGPLERKLIQHRCDIVYLPTPDDLSAGFQRLNYISTIWDLCHRETPEFPEVREFGTFFVRERNYKNNLSPALLTLTESDKLANIASSLYGVERSRFLAMPLTPTPFLEKIYANSAESVMSKYGLEKDYFFYPAQFWAHKNHIRILQALIELRDFHNWAPKVVFSGKDYGNLIHIKKYIESHDLGSQVKLLGFVPSDDIRGLYENAIAVIMPTYFGPTNLPPLEAWTLGIPLIYSVELAEQAGDAALLVDPDNAKELASAMLSIALPAVRVRLIDAGQKRLLDISKQRSEAEVMLVNVIERFALRRQCWP